jgi:hypothetical protein
MINVGDEVIVNTAPIIASPERQPSGSYAEVLDMRIDRWGNVQRYWVCPEGATPLWVDAACVSELTTPRAITQQRVDDYFAANPTAWFVTIDGCMFARRG